MFRSHLGGDSVICIPSVDLNVSAELQSRKQRLETHHTWWQAARGWNTINSRRDSWSHAQPQEKK